MDASEIKRKIVRLRILIIGRANAGKTTILKRVCKTNENPEIFDGAGKKIDIAVLTASRERGEHDIENEMVFHDNPGFIFHDSRGFEAGGESEYDKVNAFIKALPVIVLFTKFDCLYDVEFARLMENGASRKDTKNLAPKRAEDTFANGHQLKFLYHSKDIRRPPKCHVCLPDMDNDNADCGPLIERTAETLDNEVLQQLLISTQQTNLEICMKYAVERTLVASAETISYQEALRRLGVWFPHIMVVRLLILVRDRAMLIEAIATVRRV
ncbi:hypothetical protein DEU56DRAFT_961875 [Suillus clintonianus]|uniref:uncharacterized protein n=1 Tax=Suillus clintonianus TaxID=1904413 RepID=UPI001B85ECFA|nr:uncharacterized protein DEU56DRAFT_961875 [Suillus clintonianus]KAG2125459.1 hypothetical protein DEU56DRAFT_961875 [Suillus clintonianus]